MRNLGKVGWAGWCPRRGRNERREKVNTVRACTRERIVCVASRKGGELGGACAYVGVNTGARYPFPVLLSHARVPPLLFHVHSHTRVHEGARARTGVPGWYWRAHVFAERKEKYRGRAFTRRGGQGERFLAARINSGSRQQHGNSARFASPLSNPWFW